ncbi:hypothetical protein Y1Q_0020328 [Alligator mississippiensis]|uniref:Uncharacterized protein n=1 Tax=Alligator mississippiensis TaxID=8496 RepID=A0A151MLC8_ALLMI|nr:hypothetical protein Y1Q_0020328 [Alligator mississippiensis]
MGCQTEPLPVTDGNTQTKVDQCQQQPGQGERSRFPSQRMVTGTQASLPLTREASTQAEGPWDADTSMQTGALCLAEVGCQAGPGPTSEASTQTQGQHGPKWRRQGESADEEAKVGSTEKTHLDCPVLYCPQEMNT